MSQKPFNLILLLSALSLQAKQTPEQNGHDQPLTFGQLMHEFNKTIRAQFDELHKEFEILKYSEAPQKASFSETPEAVTVTIQLPEDLQFDANQLDVINGNTVNLVIKDTKYTLSLNAHLTKKLLGFNYKLEKEDKDTQKSTRNYTLQRTVHGNPQLENMGVEFHEKEHTLTFTIPKEQQKIQTKHTIDITHKK